MNDVNIIGVQFRRAGKIYDFLGKDLLVQVGDQVVVDTDRGPSLAEVIKITYEDPERRGLATMKPVIRVASSYDLDESGRLTAEKADLFTKERIKKLGLDMRLVKTEVQFGGGKAIIYFSAPGRVDFRDLVKELASGLKSRVELKQVGARDEAKLTGGLGICGREFCCSSFLREFVPVSIKMAKNQNLALNPTKVSGGCGRLLCCLTYEDETYSYLKQKLLPRGARVRLEDGTVGDVIKGDILNQRMLIETDTGELRSVPVTGLEVIDRAARTAQDDGDEWGDDLNLQSLMERKPSGAKPKGPASDEDRDEMAAFENHSTWVAEETESSFSDPAQADDPNSEGSPRASDPQQARPREGSRTSEPRPQQSSQQQRGPGPKDSAREQKPNEQGRKNRSRGRNRGPGGGGGGGGGDGPGKPD